MKKNLFSVLLLILLSQANSFCFRAPFNFEQQDKDTTHLSIDGPYVFYRGDSIVVKSFDRIDGKIQQIIKSYSISEKKKIILFCKIDNDFNLPFKFRLNKNILISKCSYPPVNKIVALSDYEGNFRGLYSMLLSSGVINKNYNWTFGKNHLVFDGDIFDRGWNVTAILWLLYKLDQEAEIHGGSVHVIIGNHESMNFWGDARYVVNKYKETAKELKLNLKQLYDENTEIGRWLRSKNIIEKVGDNLFVHGGISDTINKLGRSIEELNNLARTNFNLSKDEKNKISGEVKLLFGNDGPLWYRGYFEKNFDPKILDRTLNLFHVKNIIVGHTIVDDISQMYSGKLYPVDVDHTKENDSEMRAMLIEKNKFYKITSKGIKRSL
jgi:hypothetical protein